MAADEMERLADYYNDRVKQELGNLDKVVEQVNAAVQARGALSYAQWLEIESAEEKLRAAVHARDVFGNHSNTGRARFRQIAHPNVPASHQGA
jgi:hypothetical protein